MKIKLLCIGILITAVSFAQTNTVIISNGLILPKDTIVKKQLLSAINDFLFQLSKPNKDNTLILNSNLLETYVLLDEMKNLGKSNKYKNDTFYKPYLTNTTQLNDSNFIIQLSYIGVNENSPILRASFTLFVNKKGDQFNFFSPLKQNTVSWKTKKIDNTNIYYKTILNLSNAKVYFRKITEYDKKLKASNEPTDFYCADNFHEVLKLIGVDYKSDYNGYVHNAATVGENNHNLNVNGMLTSNFTKFDTHDLWHDRLHNILSPAIINKPVDEGTAYLYGGSWGMSWKEILEKFKIYANANQGADWLALYNESKNFDEKGAFPLNIDFVLNALIVKKIEEEKGFQSVIELLSCGKKEKGNENYFSALEKIIGINKINFNENIWAIIKKK